MLTLTWVYEVCSNLYVEENKMEFSLHFHQPCKDKCQKCGLLIQKIKLSCNNKKKTDVQQQHDIHLIMLI